MTYDVALPIAQAIARTLQPHCTRINIAGSVRRQVAEVKDIEIVCVPRTKMVPAGDLFNPNLTNKVRSCHFIRTIHALGEIIRGKTTGRYVQVLHASGIMIDIFITSKYDYYRQYAIRTGSSDYSHHILAHAWSRLGWVGTTNGLRRKDECIQQSPNKWICTAKKPTKPRAWKSEKDFSSSWAYYLPILHTASN